MTQMNDFNGQCIISVSKITICNISTGYSMKVVASFKHIENKLKITKQQSIENSNKN